MEAVRLGERRGGPDRATGEVKWTGSTVDLVIGASSQLRAIAEDDAGEDAKERSVAVFVAASARP